MATDSYPYPLNVGQLQTIADEVGTYPVRALLASGYIPDPSHEFADDVTGELSGGSYARVDLSSVTWTVVDDLAQFEADDATFASMTATAVDCMVVFADRGADSASPLIAAIVLPPFNATAEPVTIRFTGGVVLELTEFAANADDPDTTGSTAGDVYTVVTPGEPAVFSSDTYDALVGLGSAMSAVEGVLDTTGETTGYVLTVPATPGDPAVWAAGGGGGGTVDVVSNVANNTLLGRTTAGSGDSEEITVAASRLVGRAASGDIDDLDATAVKALLTYAVGDVSGAAPLASPTFTGTPAAPTAAVGTNTTQVASTAFVTANALPITGVANFYMDNIYSGLQGFNHSTLGGGGAQIVLTANLLWCWQIMPVETVQVDGGEYMISVAGAATKKARIGIYAHSNSAGPIGAPLVDSGAMDAASVAGTIVAASWTAITLQAFTPYWAVMETEDASFAPRSLVRGNANTTAVEGLDMGVTDGTNRVTRRVAHTFGALPTNPGAAFTPPISVVRPGVVWNVRRI